MSKKRMGLSQYVICRGKELVQRYLTKEAFYEWWTRCLAVCLAV
jgi:hypothetical protein